MKTRGPHSFLPLFMAVCCCLSPRPLRAQWTPMNPVRNVQQQADGIVLSMGTGTLKIQVCSDSIIRVLYSPTASFPKRTDPVVIKENWPAAKWTMQSTDDAVILSTPLLKLTVTRKDGAIAYAEAAGTPLVQEASRRMTPEKVNGEDTYRAESFVSIYGSHEGLYGLGQHQAGVWNYRGESVDISQDNTNISVPLMLSSKGYGIFWNSTARSRFNNRFPNYLYISSEVADVIDYYFLYGPEFDKIIAQLSRTDRASAHVRQVGVRILAMQESLQIAGGNPRRSQKVPRSSHPRGQHRAGLVLVESQGRVRLQQELSRPEGHDRSTAPGKFPPDDFHMALLRARIGEL